MPDTPKPTDPLIPNAAASDLQGGDAVAGASTLSQTSGSSFSDAAYPKPAAHDHAHGDHPHRHDHHESGLYPVHENAPYAYGLIS